ncbi:MAG: alpha/beta fold hydrolase [Phycisphaerae bacterium]
MTESRGGPRLPHYRRRWFQYPALAAGLYLAWMGAACACQDRLLFPRHMLRGADARMPLPFGVEGMWLEPVPGVRVEAWFLVGSGRSAAQPGPAVLFAHGNAELIEDQLDVAGAYRALGFSVLLPEYRGYGRSGGTPSEATITADFAAFVDRLAARPEVDRRRIVYHGRSLGGGVAAQLAVRRRPAAMILESTFSSVVAFAHRYGVPEWLVRNPFRTDRVIGTFDFPMLIVHGTTDDVVPVSHARRLHELAPRARYVEFAAGHNDLEPTSEALWREVVALLKRAELIP